MNKRLQTEIKNLKTKTPEFVKKFAVDETDIKKLHFLITGSRNTPYENGEYVIELNIHKDYPFKAPNIRILTPNGKFQINCDLCIAGLTSFHGEEWSPQQNFISILIGLISYMNEENQKPYEIGIGGIVTTSTTKKKLALSSHKYNEENNLLKIFDF